MFRMGISREEYLEYQLPGYPPLKDSEKPSKLSSDSGKPPKPSGKPETLKKVTCQRQEDECNSLSSASTTDTCTPKESPRKSIAFEMVQAQQTPALLKSVWNARLLLSHQQKH